MVIEQTIVVEEAKIAEAALAEEVIAEIVEEVKEVPTDEVKAVSFEKTASVDVA